MSELSAWINTDCSCRSCAAGDSCVVGAITKTLRYFLSAHEAEIREQARREQYEADCKAACYSCEACRPVRPIGDGWWTHQKPGVDMVGNCSRIRAAWAKAHEAKEKSEDVVSRSLRSRLHANETMFSEPTHG